MSDDALHNNLHLLEGGAELLDRVQPLWVQLRRHHVDLAPRWADEMLGKTFDKRRAELLAKAATCLAVWLASVHEEDIGYCVSTITVDGTGEIDTLYVVPTYRGRGVGHALMSRAMDWFANRSVPSIVVDVISGNDAAQRFYARYGFVPRTVRMLRDGSGAA